MITFNIPLSFSEGEFSITQLECNSSECFTICYDEKFGMISNKTNFNCIYDFNTNDLSACSKVRYNSSGTLEYIGFVSPVNGEELPFYYALTQQQTDSIAQQLAVSCARELTDKLIGEGCTGGDIYIDQFGDGQAYSVNLRDDNDNIYNIESKTNDCALTALCTSSEDDMDILTTVSDVIYSVLKSSLGSEFTLHSPELYD